MLTSNEALVFIDNHDNQRGHGVSAPLTYKEGGVYVIAQGMLTILFTYKEKSSTESHENRNSTYKTQSLLKYNTFFNIVFYLFGLLL